MVAWRALAARAAGAVATGVAGVAVVEGVEGVKKLSGGRAVDQSAVAVTTLGLKVSRAAEAGAERVGLNTVDVVAETRERLGEQAPPPGVVEKHDHEH